MSHAAILPEKHGDIEQHGISAKGSTSAECGAQADPVLSE